MIYSELRRLAAGRMRSERTGHTLTPTALAHEAWLRLAENEQAFENRSHFFAVASQAMRRILVDHARARNAAKRNSGSVVSLDSFDLALPEDDEQILALNEALDLLAATDQRAASVVEMRYFGGLTNQEIAQVLGVDRRTVDRDWALAKTWLFDKLSDGQ